MWGSRTKLVMPSKEKALPGRAERMPVPTAHFVNRHPLTPPFPAGLEMAVFGSGASGAPSASSGRRPGCSRPRPATRLATRRIPRTRRCAPVSPVITRSCWSSSIPGASATRDTEGLLGEPRPDAGDAPGQRRRHPVSVRDLRLLARPAPAGRGLTRRVQAVLSKARIRRRSRRRSSTRPSSTTPRTITSSTSPRTPAATAVSGEPASPVRPAFSSPPAAVARRARPASSPARRARAAAACRGASRRTDVARRSPR